MSEESEIYTQEDPLPSLPPSPSSPEEKKKKTSPRHASPVPYIRPAKKSMPSKPKTWKTSSSKRAGLLFPVGRMARLLRAGRYASRVSGAAPVYLAAVLEYLTSEVLELAGNAARDNKRARIIPRHVQLALRNDVELDQMLSAVTISQGGVKRMGVHDFLLPNHGIEKPAKRSNKKKKEKGEAGKEKESKEEDKEVKKTNKKES